MPITWDDFAEHLFDPDATEVEHETIANATSTESNRRLTFHSLKDSVATFRGDTTAAASPSRPANTTMDTIMIHDDEHAFWTDFVREPSIHSIDSVDSNSDTGSASGVYRHVRQGTVLSPVRPHVEQGEVRRSSATVHTQVGTLRSILSSSASVRSASSSTGKRTPRSVTFSDLPEVHYECDEHELEGEDEESSEDSRSEDTQSDSDEIQPPFDSVLGQGKRVRSTRRRLSVLQRILLWIRRAKASAPPLPSYSQQSGTSSTEKVDEAPRPSSPSRWSTRTFGAKRETTNASTRPIISGPIPLTSSLSRCASSSSRRSASSTTSASPLTSGTGTRPTAHRPRKLWTAWPTLSCGVS